MRLHFIGIGGIGMSALAKIALERGHIVSGSDLTPNNLTDSLKDNGASIFTGHLKNNIQPKPDLVIKSSCIRDNNPEVEKARELGVEIINRSDYLKMIMGQAYLSISVTGTHGKTTASSLIAHILEYCDKSPTAIIGAEVEILGSNAKSGTSGIMVAEVDESDGLFREMCSTYGVITNIEREHMENFGSMENLIEAYKSFLDGVDPEGTYFYNGDDTLATEISAGFAGRKISFGLNDGNEITAKDIDCGKSIKLDLYRGGDKLAEVRSPLIGKHNVMNLLSACAVCLELGLSGGEIAEAAPSFNGASRRFQLVDRINDIEVIEDYAHHPTELAAIIRAAKDYTDGRVISIFQPHRFSRTRDLLDDFVGCFYDSDILILTDIYSAHEDEDEKAYIQHLVERIDGDRFEEKKYVPMGKIPECVAGRVKGKDTVLILGAGDINTIAGEVVEQIKARDERD